MTLLDTLDRAMGKHDACRIVTWIGRDPKRFRQVLDIMLHDDPPRSPRAAWVLSLAVDAHPRLALPHANALLRILQKPDTHQAIMRSALHVLQTIPLPRRLMGTAAAVCFDALHSLKTPIAGKVFALQVLANVCEEEPELWEEVVMVIGQMLPYEGPAFRARARNVLKHAPASIRRQVGERAG